MGTWDVIVVGAGAAGLMAGITAADRGARVLILDSRPRIGAKILVSGGGRCNVTNADMDASHFRGGSAAFVDRVLRAFGLEDTLDFFEGIGVPLKLEPEMGKFFPVSNAAQSVLEALLETLRRSGASLRADSAVTAIHPGDIWRVRTGNDELHARAVLLCTGGLALPKSGSTGAGYAFAGRLGHTLVRTTPALSPLIAQPAVHAELSGITLPVRLQLVDGGDILASYEGSFLFTHTGYSGPAALNLSRHVARERDNRPDAVVEARFLPGVKDGGESRFREDLLRPGVKAGAATSLARFLPRRLAEWACRSAGVDPARPLRHVPRAHREALFQEVLCQRLPVTDVAGYPRAEATAGGVCLDEVEPATMMSRLVPNLFFAGEILDVDGELGGYNFQWAWSTGVVAGRAAARAGRR